MGQDILDFKKRIEELESELFQKNQELIQYKSKVTRLNQELENIIASVANEIQTANRLQKALSPTELPSISGVEISTKFIAGTKKGGNYFDIFEHQDKLKFSILLSSCSGFGISALLMSVLISMTSKIEARRGLAPEKLLKAIFDELKPLMGPQDHVQLFYGIFDKRNYNFQFCQVGNFITFLQQYGKDALIKLNSNYPSFNKDFNTGLQAQTVSLGSKDRLILATEGLYLNTNKQNQMWTEDQLIESIQMAPKKGVHEMRNEILFQNETFLGSPEKSHDVTILITEVKDSVIKLASE